MNPTTALNEIRRYAVQGRIKFSHHGRKRMGERGATVEDVRYALCEAKVCRASPDGPGRWEVPSVDEDGEHLVVVVVIESGVLVVSLFG